MPGEQTPGAKGEALLGKTLDGRYRIDGVLGEGGMGLVFRAMQTSVSRPVAVKTLHAHLAAAPTFFERFKREAEIASRLHHPNIITIFDFGRTPEGQCYYVMELLEGESLRQRVKREGPLTLREAVAVVEQIAIGVNHAHKQNVIHRDLKPHNIMLTPVDGEEYVKVLDFGLVKAIEQEADENLTSTGQVLGTPQYMPPEQAGGEVVDARSDLYALTGILYFCLTGQSPFGANTVRKALQAALTGQVPDVASHRLGAPVPEAVDAFIKKGLKLEKDDRHQSAEQFVTSLQTAIAGVDPAVLDAVPEVPKSEGSKDSGSGSSGASRRGAAGSRARMPSKGVSAIARRPGSGSEVGPKAESPPSEIPTAAAEMPEEDARKMIPVALVTLVILAVGGTFVMLPGNQPANPLPTKPPVTLQKSDPVPPKPPVAPALAHITFTTVPPGAEVTEEGALIGVTPVTVPWEAGAKRVLAFKLAGFKPMEKALKLDTDTTFDFTLEPLPKTGPGKKVPKKDDPPIGAFE